MSEGIYLAVAGAKGRPGSRGLDREHPEGIQAHPGGKCGPGLAGPGNHQRCRICLNSDLPEAKGRHIVARCPER